MRASPHLPNPGRYGAPGVFIGRALRGHSRAQAVPGLKADWLGHGDARLKPGSFAAVLLSQHLVTALLLAQHLVIAVLLAQHLVKRRRDWWYSQGLKPLSFRKRYGTTEVVP